MSSRALRKLQGGDLPFQEEEKEEEEEEESPPSPKSKGAKPKKKKKKNQNPFEMLDALEGSLSSEVKEDDDEGILQPPISLQNRNKKKSKKRSKRTMAANAAKSSEDIEIDEVTRSILEVEQLLGKAKGAVPKPVVPTVATHQSRLRALLSVERKNLNPENEMKKMFGAKVVAENRQSNPHRRAGGARHRAPVRSQHWLVVPKPSWPSPGKTGLSMKFEDSDVNGNQLFSFEHSKSYQEVQKDFFAAVESMHPDAIVHLLNHHPFHIDAMLQLSDICKMGEDSQMATELIERTLYAMESSFHPLFNLAVGTSRLDYRRQENRPFFIALFRHINYVGARACYRTALEFSKLVLSLDPDADPVGMLLLIDFYAIRSGQQDWFIRLFNEWSAKNLDQLPNWAYSIALAHFLSAEAAREKSGKEGDYKEADMRLQKALVNFPGVLLPLLDKCSVDTDKKVSGHRYFIDAQIGQPSGLALLSSLYIGRSHHLWKQPELLPWLERCAHAVLARVDAGDPTITEATAKRKTRYQGAPRNVYRHVIMADIKDPTTSLPRELSADPVMSYDPLPPTDSMNLYKGGALGPAGSTEIEDPSPLRVFFRSMMPNFDPAATLAPAELEAGAQPPALRDHVNGIYDAMQELLGNLNLPEIPHDAAADAEDGDSDDAVDDAEWR